MKYRCFLLLGAPGAGKGTPGKVLGVIPDFFEFYGSQRVHPINADQSPARVLAGILHIAAKP